jgi:hypothetical protein
MAPRDDRTEPEGRADLHGSMLFALHLLSSIASVCLAAAAVPLERSELDVQSVIGAGKGKLK